MIENITKEEANKETLKYIKVFIDNSKENNDYDNVLKMSIEALQKENIISDKYNEDALEKMFFIGTKFGLSLIANFLADKGYTLDYFEKIKDNKKFNNEINETETIDFVKVFLATSMKSNAYYEVREMGFSSLKESNIISEKYNQTALEKIFFIGAKFGLSLISNYLINKGYVLEDFKYSNDENKNK